MSSSFLLQNSCVHSMRIFLDSLLQLQWGGGGMHKLGAKYGKLSEIKMQVTNVSETVLKIFVPREWIFSPKDIQISL